MKAVRYLVLVGIGVALLAWSPLASAVTTVDTYEGSNVVFSNSSCSSWVIAPQNPQYTYHHTNGDSVAFPMYNKYNDQRSPGSPGRTLASSINAVYGGSGWGWGGLHHYSTGGDVGYDFGTWNPGFPVYVNTSMNVTYQAYVYDTSLNILCYDDLTVTFYFIP